MKARLLPSQNSPRSRTRTRSTTTRFQPRFLCQPRNRSRSSALLPGKRPVRPSLVPATVPGSLHYRLSDLMLCIRPCRRALCRSYNCRARDWCSISCRPNGHLGDCTQDYPWTDDPLVQRLHADIPNERGLHRIRLLDPHTRHQ